jgi:biofilm PGA synthesis N-glycosyltransferase PgaC
VFLAVVVVFLNEEEFLPRLLASIERQTRAPDKLLLVDDGSADASPSIARAFASEHEYARALERPHRSRESDRLVDASELRAFQWAVAEITASYDIVAKLDGDLELTPQVFERIVGAFEADHRLGIAGASLSVAGQDGRWRRERSAPWHIRGATKFYRRECYEQIAPLPPILGWDTIDEARATMHAWRLAIVPVPDGDSRHLRTTGSYDGRLRGFRRRGVAAWAYGAHPLYVVLGAFVRMRDRPHVLGGLTYFWSWLGAAARRAPRAEPEVVRFVQREQLGRLRGLVFRGR